MVYGIPVDFRIFLEKGKGVIFPDSKNERTVYEISFRECSIGSIDELTVVAPTPLIVEPVQLQVACRAPGSRPDFPTSNLVSYV
jgi:hypothetical protein